jgi:hypothetical protein
MPRPSLKRPKCTEIRDSLDRLVSITALAGHYEVSFTTARKWVRSCGLEAALKEEGRRIRLRKMIEEAPKIAKRSRIDRELEAHLRDQGDRKLLARAIVDEFSFGYYYKKNGRRKRHTLALEVKMYDPLPVRQVAELMGVRFRRHFRAAKDGTLVAYWETRAEGYRAFEILRLVRPYLVGQKAFQADVVLRTGPFPDKATDIGLREYKTRIFEENRPC